VAETLSIDIPELVGHDPDRSARPVGSGCVGALRADFVDGGHGVAEFGEPVVFVFADESNAPRERVGA
jgi:hypothetical protein